MAKNELNKSPKNYATSPPETPFTKAEKKWDDRIGNARVQAYNWRMGFFGMLLFSFLLAGGLIYQSTKATVTPYVVEVGPDGTARAIGQAQAANYNPKEAEVKYFLAQFVQLTRGVSSDAVLYRQNWMKAYTFMEKNASSKVNSMMSKDQQATLLQNKNTVQVTILSLLPTTQSSWQARWKEEIFDQSGQSTGFYNMTGLFTITFQPPTNEKDLINNPLGIIITDLTWNRDY